MTQSDCKLPNPPIVEAVLGIECDLQPDLQLSEYEKKAGQVFLDSYPKFRKQFFQKHQIKQRQGDPLEHTVLSGVQALQFLKDDERQLVQVRCNGYSFNRLAPYASLDDYLPEIERTWRLFVEVVKPVQIILFRLRYINRILLPMEEGSVNLDDYFHVGPRLPNEDRLTFTGFLNQHSAVEKETGNKLNIVLAAQQPEGDKLPVIFDNTVTAQAHCEVEDWPLILEKIRVLRSLKNRIFKGALTEKCLDLFR